MEVDHDVAEMCQSDSVEYNVPKKAERNHEMATIVPVPSIDDEMKTEAVDITTILSKEKIEELYEIYWQSKVQFLIKCDELGFKDEFADKLFHVFETSAD